MKRTLLSTVLFLLLVTQAISQLGAVTLVAPDPIPSPLLPGVTYNFIFEYDYLPNAGVENVDASTVVSTALTGSAIFAPPTVVNNFVSIEITPLTGDLTIRVEMDDDDPLTIASLGEYTSSPLIVPVEFGVVKASQRDESILIEWTTLSEQNNDYFVLERSYDGENFEGLDNYAGMGTSNTEVAYQAYDYDFDKRAGSIYYRLKQMDYDGNYTHSEIVSIRNQDDRNMRIENIRITDLVEINLFSSDDTDATVAIHDFSGRLIINKNYSVLEGSNLLAIEKEGLTSQLYIVSISSGNQRIIKKIFL